MMDKGYPFPLHSLDRIAADAAPIDDPFFAVPVPGGRLQVRRGLRRRGERTSTLVCEDAARAALRWHAEVAESLAPFGFGPAWAEALRHWTAFLRAPMEERFGVAAQEALEQEQRHALLQQARLLLRRLAFSARMAQVVGGPRSPRTQKEACAALGAATALCQGPLRGVLAEHGFGPAQCQALLEVHAALGPAQERSGQLAAARRAQGAVLAVVRGALLGDLGRLCQAAPVALGLRGGPTLSRLLAGGAAP